MFRFTLPVFLLAAVCFAENPLAGFHRSDNILEDSHKIEAHFKDVLKTGIKEWDLPVLEPFHIEESVEVDMPDFKVDNTYTHINIEGLSSVHSTKFVIEPKTNKLFHDYELSNVKISGHAKKLYEVEPKVEFEHEFTIEFPKLSFAVVKTVDMKAGTSTLDSLDVKFLEAPVFEVTESMKKALAAHPHLKDVVEHAKNNSADYMLKAFHPIFLKISANLGEYYRHPFTQNQA